VTIREPNTREEAHNPSRIDASALIEAGANVSPSASVWQYSKVRDGATVGSGTRIGGWVYVEQGVDVGSDCKIENLAQLFEGASVGDGVFVGPGVLLTNDRHPRAVRPDGLIKNSDDWEMAGVEIRRGAALGAGAIVLPSVVVGEWALVAAGAVVTVDVLPHGLAVGSPARRLGWVCRCAMRVVPPADCDRCGYYYELQEDRCIESRPL
jgi:UDP-2-acetamido-3-amino-2,3-dideoxy-glucuronate N-acetyltransferase